MRNVMSLLVLAASLILQSMTGAQVSRVQIHFMDVWQGDGAILIAPSGETVLFDNGVCQCAEPTDYLKILAITKIDDQIISHYHRDHHGCTAAVLGKFGFNSWV